jgi:tripartite-type tricarboxylate transporter receptor subunit TctC
MNFIQKMATLLCATATAAVCAPVSAAEAFPNKPITLLIGFAPGGGADNVGRIIATRMGAALHTSVIVENKAGAGGGIASQSLARAAPDGYTIMLSTIGSLAVNQHLGVPLGYDPQKDFSFISTAVAFPNVLVVNSQTGIKTLADLTAALKAGDSKLSYGSSGVGSAGHLAGELFKETLSVKGFPHVPFRGGAPAMNDLLGNNIPVLFAAVGDVIPQVKGGKITALAVTSPERAPLLPGVKTLDELGLKGFNMTNWYGFIAPKGTPPAVINKLHDAVIQALKDPAVDDFMAQSGMTPFPSNPKEMAAYVDKESDKWGKLIKEADIKP